MVAGGGASVIYSDTICDLGGASELANYGEYSGKYFAHNFVTLMTAEDQQRILIKSTSCRFSSQRLLS